MQYEEHTGTFANESFSVTEVSSGDMGLSTVDRFEAMVGAALQVDPTGISGKRRDQ